MLAPDPDHPRFGPWFRGRPPGPGKSLPGAVALVVAGVGLRRPAAAGAEPRATGAGADPAGTAATRTDLANALSGLPPDQRAAVLLVDAEGLDYDAAATVLGVAPGTIASRLSRARAALRAALAEGETR